KIQCILQRLNTMSGPIVRTGTTPEFWKNYDRIFGEPKPAGGRKAAKKASKKAAKKTSGGQS
ncbi:MAG: hypothetical protein ACK5DM_08705, partial [Planctomyces sp.]